LTKSSLTVPLPAGIMNQTKQQTRTQQQRTDILQLTWLGAAGFRIDTREGAVILIDPFLSRPEGASPTLSIQLVDLSPVDEILLTHGCFDHAMDTPALVKHTGAIVHAPESVCQQLAKMGVPANNRECIKLHKTKRVGRLDWQALPAEHSQAAACFSRSTPDHQQTVPHLNHLERQWPPGETVAYFFQSSALSMIHLGNSAWVEATVAGLQPDIALLPLERPTDIAKMVQLISLLKPKVVIPHHWDNYYPPLSRMVDLNDFEAMLPVKVPGSRVCKPPLGERFRLADLV
jgi:L-ascorbate metabolism protein UlaG (beta-lactamase superfamily)